MQKKALAFGTFDGLHEGHEDFFRQAKKFGDNLIVERMRMGTATI